MKQTMSWTVLAAVFAVGAIVATGIPSGAQTRQSSGMTTKMKLKKPATVVKYKAQCGMVYSAADAKKDHYICPMDHKPLKKIVVSAKAK